MAKKEFGFPCPHCHSPLEADSTQSGEAANCPTCGSSLAIPHLDELGQVVETPAEPAKMEETLPLVHAYAAAGAHAPLWQKNAQGALEILCPRCGELSDQASDACQACQLPFCLDALEGEASAFPAICALLTGLVGLLGAMLFFPSVMAILLGMRALRTPRAKRLAWIGIFLGLLGLVIGVFYWVPSLLPAWH